MKNGKKAAFLHILIQSNMSESMFIKYETDAYVLQSILNFRNTTAHGLREAETKVSLNFAGEGYVMYVAYKSRRMEYNDLCTYI